VSTQFIKRGFTQTASYGALVYAHGFDASADWIRTTELSILTTAIFEQEALMILSSSPAAVELCLATRAGEAAALDEESFAVGAVGHLGAPAAAVILRGLGECVRFSPNPILDLLGTIPNSEKITQLRAKMQERRLLVPYRALAVGYRVIEADPVGTIVFEYDAPELADADLPARLLLAEEGVSTYYGAPIRESYFTVFACEPQDNAIVMTVAPVNGQPSRLFRMIFTLDAAFAGCSS
jgi:hypothetical protein